MISVNARDKALFTLYGWLTCGRIVSGNRSMCSTGIGIGDSGVGDSVTSLCEDFIQPSLLLVPCFHSKLAWDFKDLMNLLTIIWKYYLHCESESVTVQ